MRFCAATGAERDVAGLERKVVASLLRLLQAAVFDKLGPLLDVAAEEFLERRFLRSCGMTEKAVA